ncbi:NADH-quinone oxidoreductase subunit C [Dyadobacter sandarakinus]|uniref:NADH-quinone oxidoreductase subunit C n=1 Tax=Dyadobacter sandarakinus TaxID=2747268 RepID=A0ABX7I4Q9_9BACT|nr:NADH-quinone oxidoreductase subunit C [Dyadobacter sandarakinus]QRR01074.1 NADH-quinone oxidoreductase subunit C [Dyadobacter sandarakinus]
MDFQELTDLVKAHFPQYTIEADMRNPQPALLIPASGIADICAFLHADPRLFFDFLACITAIDNGPEKGTMELIYNMTSIPYGRDLVLKMVFARNEAGTPLPAIPTVSHIWRTADWHEREIFDLMGIAFTGHPDLRRILLPEDWDGHPLRRDYAVEGRYHGIYIRFEDGTTQERVSSEDRR